MPADFYSKSKEILKAVLAHPDNDYSGNILAIAPKRANARNRRSDNHIMNSVDSFDKARFSPDQ